MKMEPISETLRGLLVRQGLANGRAVTLAERGNTASSESALSFMEWANLLLDREGDDANSPPTGRSRRMGNGGKGRGALKAPPVWHLEEQSLRLVSSRRGGAQRRTSTPPRLVLIIGGKS